MFPVLGFCAELPGIHKVLVVQLRVLQPAAEGSLHLLIPASASEVGFVLILQPALWTWSPFPSLLTEADGVCFHLPQTDGGNGDLDPGILLTAQTITSETTSSTTTTQITKVMR